LWSSPSRRGRSGDPFALNSQQFTGGRSTGTGRPFMGGIFFCQFSAEIQAVAVR
jgi:hypothetical protein